MTEHQKRVEPSPGQTAVRRGRQQGQREPRCSFRRRGWSKGQGESSLWNPEGSPIPDTLVTPVQPLSGTLLNQETLKEGEVVGGLGKENRQGMPKRFGTERLPRRIRRECFIFTFFLINYQEISQSCSVKIENDQRRVRNVSSQ